jgi:hypothetical protein
MEVCAVVLWQIQWLLKIIKTKIKKPIARINAINIMENNLERELTFGEKAVGLNFNPSGDEKVIKAKQLMADAIDLLEQSELEKSDYGKIKQNWEANVFRTNAFNKIIDAQMSLVKYITWNN